MTADNTVVALCDEVELRARRSLGLSCTAIYNMVAAAIESRHARGGLLLDIGCGEGRLREFIGNKFDEYVGVDAVRYDALPNWVKLVPVNFDKETIPLDDGIAEIVAAVEVVEHLENPRAFVRQLVRLARPGGWVLLTTPNQLSVLSKLTLVLKNQFNAFQKSDYPAHITALLESDLRRIATESGLSDVYVSYSRRGRFPLTPWHYPARVSRLFPRLCSDNVLLMGRKHDLAEIA